MSRSFLPPNDMEIPTMTTFAPEHAAVWFEIPVGDLARAKAFYGAVLGAPLTKFALAFGPAVSGNLLGLRAD